MFTRRSSLIPLLCLGVSVACLSQTPAAFQTRTFNGYTFIDVQPIDLNNDGVPDLVQHGTCNNGSCTNAFTVSIANGDGSFRTPVTYTVPTTTQQQGLASFTVGDFNNDGKADIVFADNLPTVSGASKLVVFLGNGDGTFQAARFVAAAFPPGATFNGAFTIAAADFNGDGKLDIAAPSTSNNQQALFLFPGDGTGNFGAPRLLYQGTGSNGIGAALATGDFDGNGKADLAWTEILACQQIACSHRLHVQYGDGTFNFADTTPYTAPGYYHFSVGDLNSDGRTDIFGLDAARNSELAVLYGQTSRTFALYTQATSGIDASRINLAEGKGLAMADFNGDGRMDLVALGGTPNASNDNQLVFLLANTNPGSFTEQRYAIPGSGFEIVPVVGDFNKDTKPDVLTLSATNTTPSSAELIEAVNTTATGNWGGCAYPNSALGIRICAPANSAASPVNFSASANSFGQLRKVELWVDGAKIAEEYHTWGQRAYFTYSRSFAAGTHNGVFYAADVDNRLQRVNFPFTVGSSGSSCTIPTSPGVHVCAPANNSTVSSPVTAQASSAVTGTPARMELWVDGVKRFTGTSNSLNTTVTLAAGTHRFDFYAVNTGGQKWETTVFSTVR